MKKEHGSFFGTTLGTSVTCVFVCFVVLMLVNCLLLLLLLLPVLIDGILIAVVGTVLEGCLMLADDNCSGILVLECVICMLPSRGGI